MAHKAPPAELRRLAWRVLTAVEDGAFADAVLAAPSAARIWTRATAPWRPSSSTARSPGRGSSTTSWRASAASRAASMRTCGRRCGSRCSRSSSSTACRSSPPSTRPSISRRRSRAARRAAWSTPSCAASCARGGRWRCRRNPTAPVTSRWRRRTRAGWSSAGSTSSGPMTRRRCWRATTTRRRPRCACSRRADHASTSSPRSPTSRPRRGRRCMRPTVWSSRAPPIRSRSRLARGMVHRPGRGLAARRRDARRGARRARARRLRRARRQGALAAAGTVGPEGLTVALDPHHAGLARLRAEAGRLGLRVARVRADATQLPLANDARFDAVLVDAPCSGLGTLRQHPEIRWRRQPADVAAPRGAADTSPRRRLLPRPSRRSTGLRHLHDLASGERRRRRRLPLRARRVQSRESTPVSPRTRARSGRRARRPPHISPPPPARRILRAAHEEGDSVSLRAPLW